MKKEKQTGTRNEELLVSIFPIRGDNQISQAYIACFIDSSFEQRFQKIDIRGIRTYILKFQT